ncbi:MAG: M48 family metalloprotease [Bryobacteraceae bacterium]
MSRCWPRESRKGRSGSGQGVISDSKDKDIALGQQLALEFRQRTAPPDNAAVSDYVKRWAPNWPRSLPGEWTYQIETIREGPQSGATHEPTAFPGGFIFVSVDPIAAARNEAEFAGMLAHAMAHVAARHGTRLVSRYGSSRLTRSLPWRACPLTGLA